MKNLSEGVRGYAKIPKDAVSYLRFLRIWWDGPAADVVMWWLDGDGRCQYLVATTGETYRNDISPNIVVHLDIESRRFEQLMASAAALGALEISDDYEAFVFSNSFDVISMRSLEGISSSFRVRTGAPHRDPRYLEIFELIVRNAKEYWNDDE